MQSGRSVSSSIERDRPCHQPDLVRERIADVDVEHVGGLDLLGDVDLDLREIACLELRLERLAARRVDALADDRERTVGTDDDRLRLRLENRFHSSPFRLVWVCRVAGTGLRCRPRGGS